MLRVTVARGNQTGSVAQTRLHAVGDDNHARLQQAAVRQFEQQFRFDVTNIAAVVQVHASRRAPKHAGLNRRLRDGEGHRLMLDDAREFVSPMSVARICSDSAPLRPCTRISDTVAQRPGQRTSWLANQRKLPAATVVTRADSGLSAVHDFAAGKGIALDHRDTRGVTQRVPGRQRASPTDRAAAGRNTSRTR